MVQGPTIPSIKSFVQQVSKVSPDVLELAFNSWELGVDPLYLMDAQGTNVTYDLGKFTNGYMDGSGDSCLLVLTPFDCLDLPCFGNNNGRCGLKKAALHQLLLLR